jgi:hypothetical protein
MGNNKEIRVVLGTLRYKSAPETSLALQVPFVQNVKEIIEYDRSVTISLAQAFDDERQKSTVFRPTAKFSIIFKNAYTGKTNYNPFENNLSYVNTKELAKRQCAEGANNVSWIGFPQYNEFDFIRNDYNVVGYTVPPNNHISFITKSASSYNWNYYLSYPYSNNKTKTLNYTDSVSSSQTNWVCGNGIPFIITNVIDSGNNLLSFRCPVKHGLIEGEYVELNISYLGNKYFEVYSLGNGLVNSESTVFNIYNYGFTGTTFNDGIKGTFKRVIDINNPADTTSEYYVKQLKIISSDKDCVLNKSGFEQNVFGQNRKFEGSGFTPDKQSKVTVREGSQSYNVTFNKDFDLNKLVDNQKRPISEVFVTVIWKGYFGWMFGANGQLKQGYDFNLQLVSGKPSTWWSRTNTSSNTGFPMDSYTTPLNTLGSRFYYVKTLPEGTVIDGDFCEWNDYDQTERTLSTLYHKMTFNETFFDVRLGKNESNLNQLGYYYQPNHKMTLRVYSDYIEEGDSNNIVGLPNYAYFSTSNNSFIWRDIYTYGYIDQDNRGVDYPFINGKHYPYKNFVFRIIPEGTNFVSDNIINDPLTDDCE